MNIILHDKVANFIVNNSYLELPKGTPEGKFNYVDVSDKKGIVTFIPPGKKPHRVFKSKFRSEIKIGRLARHILKEKGEPFTDKEIEDFVNSYKSTLSTLDDKFEIVKGEDIKYWYDEKNYASQSGCLGSSCMKNVPSNYFDLYSKNKNVSLLILTKSSRKFPWITKKKKLIGRALIWNIDFSACDSKVFMDRVYTNDISDANKFYRIAKLNGWVYKHRECAWQYNTLLGDCSDLPISVKICGNQDKYPYLDTFRWMNSSKSFLASNQAYVEINNDGDKYYEMISIYGGCNEYELVGT